MKNHTKVFMNYWGYDESDFIPCFNCNKKAVDIHHLKSRGQGGSKLMDYPENLIAVCRSCHNKANGKKFNKILKLHLMEKIVIKIRDELKEEYGGVKDGL